MGTLPVRESQGHTCILEGGHKYPLKKVKAIYAKKDESVITVKHEIVYKMVKDLILAETVKLHNKTLAHITTMCKYILHPEVGQRMCILYKNAIMSILNGTAPKYSDSHLATMMIAIGCIYKQVEKDVQAKTNFTFHGHLLAALATDQKEDDDTSGFKMTLYRALGINKSVSGAIPPKTLMGQIHSALQLEDHGKFDMHVPSKPQYQSSLDDNDEIKSGPASVKEIAKKMHEAVSLRKLFYRVKFYTEAQEKAAGFKANTKDKVILMHEREVKEQLKRITKNISTISNIDELKKISNALGITSVPFVLDVSKIDKTKVP